MKPKPQELPGIAGLFSEIFSEIPRSRGRPRKYDRQNQQVFLDKALGGQARCLRSQQNYMNWVRAVTVIKTSEGSAKILEYFKTKKTLLAEIGRIEDEVILKRVAGKICSKFLRGAEARCEIKRVRKPEWSHRRPTSWILYKKLDKVLREHRISNFEQLDKDFQLDFDSAQKLVAAYVKSDPGSFKKKAVY